MAFVNRHLEEREKSLQDYTSPQCEDINVQMSDSKLKAAKYEIKARIIEMVAAGMETDNPYSTTSISRHYAIRYDKKEFAMNGSSGISFPTRLLVKQRRIHLHPSKLEEIGIS
jgi:hypothetical protein